MRKKVRNAKELNGRKLTLKGSRVARIFSILNAVMPKAFQSKMSMTNPRLIEKSPTYIGSIAGKKIITLGSQLHSSQSSPSTENPGPIFPVFK